jgi:hypothetical protein
MFPLKPEHVERIRAVDPERVEVIYEPDLLPPTRYVGGPLLIDSRRHRTM